MLWIPTKETRKKITRLRRRQRRQKFFRLLLLLCIGIGVTSATVPPNSALSVQIHKATAPYQFDFVNWESQALADELQRRWGIHQLSPDRIEQQLLLDRFLKQERKLRTLKQELNEVYANNTQDALLADEFAVIKADQAKIIPQIEILLAQQIEEVLYEEGFAKMGYIFPPLTFRLVEPPTVLILSPRDEIRIKKFVGLAPGLENHLREQIEESLHQKGDISGYITNIGGLASYPTMVIRHSYLPYLIDVVAHEWIHNYLYTFPTNLAWSYGEHPRLTTINETAADIAGEEISRKVIIRFYPEWVESLPPLNPVGQPVPSEPSEFHLTMRAIRVEVDRLLSEGKIEAAEAYMEAERLKLVEKGYHLRKLNQAYFAFHGSYALSPTSVDPIGPQIRQLRANSPSLKAFIDRAGWLNSYEDYQAWVAEVTD